MYFAISDRCHLFTLLENSSHFCHYLASWVIPSTLFSQPRYIPVTRNQNKAIDLGDKENKNTPSSRPPLYCKVESLFGRRLRSFEVFIGYFQYTNFKQLIGQASAEPTSSTSLRRIIPYEDQRTDIKHLFVEVISQAYHHYYYRQLYQTNTTTTSLLRQNNQHQHHQSSTKSKKPFSFFFLNTPTKRKARFPFPRPPPPAAGNSILAHATAHHRPRSNSALQPTGIEYQPKRNHSIASSTRSVLLFLTF